MNLSLPSPCAADMLALRNDRAAIRAALDLKTQLARIVAALQPETLVAVALQRAPGFSMLEAVGALSVIASRSEAEVASFNALARAVQAEEAERIKPIFDAAVRCMFDRAEKISNYPRRIELAKSDSAASVKKLIEAGASQADAERIASEKQGATVAELEAERDALIAEHELLKLFVKTKAQSDIPDFLTL